LLATVSGAIMATDPAPPGDGLAAKRERTSDKRLYSHRAGAV
jgi:hypothetical protein